VVHGGKHDIELLSLLHPSNKIAPKIFDTQTAAAFVGFGSYISFAKLLEQELKVELDKGQTMSDWSKRPLTAKQIEYALNDVRYILQLRHALHAKLTEKNRLTMFEGLSLSFALFLSPFLYPSRSLSLLFFRLSFLALFRLVSSFPLSSFSEEVQKLSSGEVFQRPALHDLWKYLPRVRSMVSALS
jgi:hypothetical protein